MKLVGVKKFIERKFAAGCAPHINTVRRLIREKKLSGRVLGRRYYVDELAFEAGLSPAVEKVLRDVSRTS